MQIVLIGTPGSGKETQAQKVAEIYHILHISSGEMRRSALFKQSAQGIKANKFMDAGILAPDEIILHLLEKRLQKEDIIAGFILDGVPRNLPQAVALDGILEEINKPLQICLLIDVNFDALLKRISGRLTCVLCGRVYHRYTSPPRQENICDRCGGERYHRVDDNEETVRKHLEIYQNETEPMIEYYDSKGILRRINGMGEIEDVTNAIQAEIERITRLKS